MVLFLKAVSLMKGKDVQMLSVGDWESCLVCDTGLDGSGAAGWLAPPTQEWTRGHVQQPLSSGSQQIPGLALALECAVVGSHGLPGSEEGSQAQAR